MKAIVAWKIGEHPEDEPIPEGFTGHIELTDLPGDFTDVQAMALAVRELEEHVTVPQRGPIDGNGLYLLVLRVDPEDPRKPRRPDWSA